MAVITELGSGFYAIELGESRAFLIVGDERALMVDTGGQPCDLQAQIRAVTELPCDLFCTHSDGDHTCNHNQFPSAYCHEAELAVFKAKPTNVTIPLIPVPDEHVFDLGGVRLEVVHTPGHTAGHCCLLNRDDRWLISGDIVSYDTVFLFGPTRDLMQYRETLDELCKLRDEFSLIYPCHGVCPIPVTALDEIRSCVDETIAGNLCGESEAFPFPVEGTVLKYTLGNCSIFTEERNIQHGTSI